MQAQKSNSTSALKKDVEQLGKTMRDVAEDSVEFVRENVQDVGERMEGKIKKYPLRAVMIAAGIGFLLGALRK